MAEPGNQPDKAALMKILLPLGAVAFVVVLVAILWKMSGPAATMSDGSNGTENDSALSQASEGVRYRDLREGAGDPVKAGERVKVKYKGWLTDGTVFDSSETSEFTLNPSGLIRGWCDGIPGMRSGGVRKLVISPDAGYGSVDKGKIPPNSTLIFEILLISVSPPPKDTSRPGRAPPVTLSDKTMPGDDDAKLIEIRPGLKYRDIKVGNGTRVPEGATVTVDYSLWLLNNKSIESSLPQPAPATFSLSGSLIAGWKLGIPGMMPGGVRKLVISPELGYANSTEQPGIPPGSTLVFEIELHNSK
jgi:FKBP-type peptidyl-prolyl cis-trans isomerase